MHVLVTGSAGFIAYHVITALLERGDKVTGVDLIETRSGRPKIEHESYQQLSDYDLKMVDSLRFPIEVDAIIHLAGVAGVGGCRPDNYFSNNTAAFSKLLKVADEFSIDKIVYASSSSVYGDGDGVIKSFYAASKRAMEHEATAYNHMLGCRYVGLRFFNVYGAYNFKGFPFCVLEHKRLGQTISISDLVSRDFTHVSDIVNAVLLALDVKKSSLSVDCIFDVGVGRSNCLEYVFDRLNPGGKFYTRRHDHDKFDIITSKADLSKTRKYLGYAPKVTLEDGLEDYKQWFEKHYAATTK